MKSIGRTEQINKPLLTRMLHLHVIRYLEPESELAYAMAQFQFLLVAHAISRSQIFFADLDRFQHITPTHEKETKQVLRLTAKILIS